MDNKEEKKYEEENIENEDLDYEENDVVVEKTTSSNQNKYDSEFREKIIKMFKIVLIALVIILVFGFIISLFNKKSYTYSSVEDVMKNAAIKYFKDNSNRLPKDESEIVEISADVLISNNYMKKLDHYMRGTTCTGKVSVEKSGTSSYNYIPLLSCDNYTTTSLVDTVKNTKNIVEDGYGLYFLNNEYVYRGLEVNNYLKLSGSEIVWRIVKINSNDEIVLISEQRTINQFSWDRRYNSTTKDTSGLGVYHNSDMSRILGKVFDNTLATEERHYDKERVFISESDKSKIVEFDACVGTRSEKDTSKDGSTECATTEKTKMALLPVYDFLNASLDNNCTSTEKRDCQNYNYLVTKYTYWLATGCSDKTNRVYRVSSSIYKRTANSSSSLRVVVHLNKNTTVIKGDGSKDNPYIVR